MTKLFTGLIALFIFALALVPDAQAQRRPNRPGRSDENRPDAPRPRPGYPREGDVSCRVFATRLFAGRIFGYDSCERCLSSNSACKETCTERVATCTVVGTRDDGVTREFRGAGRDRFDAENEARRACDFNRNMRSCRTKSCGNSTRDYSSRRCQ